MVSFKNYSWQQRQNGIMIMKNPFKTILSVKPAIGHLLPVSTEDGDRLSGCLILEFANHFVLGSVEEWTALVE